jgi:hypothetical protein
METGDHLKTGAEPKSLTSRTGKDFLKIAGAICLLTLGLWMVSGCNKNENEDESAATITDEADLAKAVYCLKYALQVSTDYNDKKLSPSSISGIANVSYYPNGSLSHMSFNTSGALTTSTIVSFRIDVGRRPGTTCETSSNATAEAATTAMYNGTYNFDKDPANIVAYFGGFMGHYIFMLPSSMHDVSLLGYYKMITNGDAVTEELYRTMAFATNCYKMIVYGKNKEGKVIGKYMGFSTGQNYQYWCINPENPNYGKPAVVNF